MEDSLKKRYIVKLLASFIAGIFNIILIAIVPKALGPIAFGQFSYLQQSFSQVIAFFDAGTSTAFFTKLSAKHERKELISFYFLFSVLLLLLLYSFIYLGIFFGYSDNLLPNIPIDYIYFGLWFGFLTWLTQIYVKISDAYALTVSVEVIKILHKAFSLLLLICFIHYLTFDLSSYFYFHYLSLVSFILIITVLFVKKEIFTSNMVTFKLAYKQLTSEFIKFSSPLLVFNTVAILIALFDIWLLQKVSGSMETGFYGLAYSIAAMCFLFTGSMTPLITREFSKAYEKKEIEKIKKLFKRYVPMLYAIAAYFGVFISFESENLIGIFTDEKFQDAYFVLVVMAFYPVHQTYGQLNGSLFFAMEKTALYRNIGLISALIGLMFTFIFIYMMELGAVGFAWKMVLIQIISVNIQLYFNAKLLNLNILPFLTHQILSVMFFCAMAFVSTQMIFIGENGIMIFLAKGIFYTFLVLVGTMLVPYIFSTNRDEIFGLLNNLKAKVK
ncbi:oligosaccharide flippase family protein [Sulfurimonas sp.]|jgi:O-antigen/teichoic acid export membrane protein|uniref:lipopolysaccharide biosynthesis protein n=1 Tax=Sulfurimonas sp. TaxID=2022749 RepID=UPI0025D0F2E8|nr:oligosaccharide flippase family protein [Sulfurimonas sp.]MBT5935166.1 lipopolysaccharide biosynthesis protein [Sulfurimonas sp.]